MTIGSPPTCCTRVARADSETAIRAVIFSMAGRRRVAVDDIARERGMAEWYVPTTGTSLAQRASRETLGAEGSCTWRTSKGRRPTSAVPGYRARSERDARDGAVEPDRHGLASGRHIPGQVRRRIPRRQDSTS